MSLRRLAPGVAAAFLLTSPSLAEREARCEDFLLFQGANVNTLVRQFMGLEDPASPLSMAGQQLGRIVHWEALHTQIGFGPLGCVFLHVDPWSAEQCSNEYILDRGRGMLPQGRGLILVSGHFEEADGEIFLLTRMEFERKGQDESITLASSDDTGESGFLGELPVTSVSFSPRRFGTEEISRLTSAMHRPMVLYSQPSAVGDSAVLSVDQLLEEFPFQVIESRPGWMYVGSPDGGPEGWVRVPDAIGNVPLRRLMPELGVVQATAIYLQTRIAGTSLPPDRRRRHMETFWRLLDDFRLAAQPGGDQRALGMLEAMFGTLELEEGGAGHPEAIAAAREHFERAAEALPASGSALALRDLSRILVAPSADPTDSAVELEKTFLRLMKLDPRNVTHRVNLERLYVREEARGSPLPIRTDVPKLREKLTADPEVRVRLQR